jgi:uncharacterized protein (TIGR03790 family)
MVSLLAWRAEAGGGPANVLVLFNGDDPDAAGVAQYYSQTRSIPDAQLCAITGLDPLQRAISFDDYETQIHVPFETCLDAQAQPEEIDYVVIVRGLPYRVDIESGYHTSLSAMVQIHRAFRTSTSEQLAGTPQHNSGSYFEASILNPAYIQGMFVSGDYEISNPYQTWYVSATGIVRADSLPPSFRSQSAGSAGGYTFDGNLFQVTRLDGFDYDDARALVDRAEAADGTFPDAELLCMQSSDQPRGARDPECEFVARHLAMAGFTASFLTPFDGSLSGHDLAAYLTGTAGLRDGISGNTYAPGAVACNLTSFGAAPANFFCSEDGATCPASESQTSIARFIRAGATAAHGTVAEPLNNCFPNAGALLLYTFGYNMAESFFMSQRFLYWQNIYLGDPLTTPYAERPEVTIESEGTQVQGEPLLVSATHPDGVAGMVLYLDGVRTADSDTDSISHVIDDPEGTSIEVLAVAFAENAPVTRTGWPNPDAMPNPDVQGWSAVTVTVVPSAPDPEPDVSEPLPDPSEPGQDAGADVEPADGAADTGWDAGADMDDEDDGGGEAGCGCRVVVS